jgi:G3E family GTPase
MAAPSGRSGLGQLTADMTGERTVAARRGPLPVTVLCGFLGSGKTTLLQRLLHRGPERRYAVLVNDLSDLAVDAELNGNMREGRGDKIVNLHRGSLGGALREQLRAALEELEADATTDYLLVETSGGTQPGALIEELLGRPGVRLDTFATLVDGLNLVRDYDGGRALLDADAAPASSPIALLRAQIAPASLLLVSKADRLTRPQADAIIAVLQQINRRATIITMAYGEVDAKYLIDARTFSASGPRATPAPPDDPARFDLGSDVLADPRPFHPQRLHALFTERLPLGLHRSKGWLWLASRPADVFVWNQSGSQVGLEWSGTWRAAILDEPSVRLRPEERAALEARLAATHPVFGDRACELTIIGAARDRAVFLSDLRSCLCTEREVAAWQRGETFPDPWPQTMRTVG